MPSLLRHLEKNLTIMCMCVLLYAHGCICLCLYVRVAFSLLGRIWGECSTIHSPLCFFKVEISLRTLTPLFRPGELRQLWLSDP